MVISLVLLFILNVTTLCFPDQLTVDGWRGIVPLHSTRADVERLLGPASDECKCGYYLDNVNVSFVYSSFDCKTGGAWDVPLDTVLRIIVYLKPSPKFSDLNLDKTKFSEKHVGHLEDIVSYVRNDEGLIIEVNRESDMVLGFYYGPAAKDQNLGCRKSQKTNFGSIDRHTHYTIGHPTQFVVDSSSFHYLP